MEWTSACPARASCLHHAFPGGWSSSPTGALVRVPPARSSPVLIFPSRSCCMLPARLSNASTCESLTKGLLCAAYVTEQAGSVHNPQEQLSAKSCPSPFGWDDPASRFTLSPGAPSPTAHNKAHESSFFMAPFLVSFLSFPTYAPSKLPSKPL